MGNSGSTQRPSATSHDVADKGKDSEEKGSLSPHENSNGIKSKRVPSLDLPDLSALRHDYHKDPPKSASIPIPSGAGSMGRRGHEKVYIQPADHIPKHLTANEPNQYFRGGTTKPKTRGRKQEQREQRMPIPNPDSFGPTSSSPPPNIPGAPPPSRANLTAPPASTVRVHGQNKPAYQQVVLNSLLAPPIRLDRGEVREVPVKICWNGGGDVVMLARAGDNDWNGRLLLNRDTPQTHSVMIPLLPGTHHLRFLVDDQWRVADDLPTAVDDQGSLANYVGVGLEGFVATATPIVPSLSPVLETHTSPGRLIPPSPAPHRVPGQSFWSSTSSHDNDEPEEIFPKTKHGPPRPTGNWTSDIPVELERAARAEEAYLQATSGQGQQAPVQRERGRDRTHRSQATQVINGFIPIPQIPDAPNLPRHLDRLILNVRSTGAGASTAGTSTVVGASAGGRSSAVGERRGTRRDRPDRGRRGLTNNTFSAPRARLSGEEGRDFEAAPSTSAESGPTATTPIATSSIPVDNTVATDDTSVLPVPSHAVLHHLSTSAIRNGILAVGSTVRYKEKYLTTIYYKPTDMN